MPSPSTLRRCAIAEHDFDFVNGNACFSADDLCEDCIGPGADVLRPTGDPGRAIVAQVYPRLAGETRGNPGASGQSPAEREAIALHRTWLRVALGPAELFRAGGEALLEVPRRKGDFQSFVDLRFVQQA